MKFVGMWVKALPFPHFHEPILLMSPVNYPATFFHTIPDATILPSPSKGLLYPGIVLTHQNLRYKNPHKSKNINKIDSPPGLPKLPQKQPLINNPPSSYGTLIPITHTLPTTWCFYPGAFFNYTSTCLIRSDI